MTVDLYLIASVKKEYGRLAHISTQNTGVKTILILILNLHCIQHINQGDMITPCVQMCLLTHEIIYLATELN